MVNKKQKLYKNLVIVSITGLSLVLLSFVFVGLMNVFSKKTTELNTVFSLMTIAGLFNGCATIVCSTIIILSKWYVKQINGTKLRYGIGAVICGFIVLSSYIAFMMAFFAKLDNPKNPDAHEDKFWLLSQLEVVSCLFAIVSYSLIISFSIKAKKEYIELDETTEQNDDKETLKQIKENEEKMNI